MASGLTRLIYFSKGILDIPEGAFYEVIGIIISCWKIVSKPSLQAPGFRFGKCVLSQMMINWGYLLTVSSAYRFSRLSVIFFPPKAGLVWKFFPEGAQRSQTVLKPKAEGQSDFFGLLKERISRLDPT